MNEEQMLAIIENQRLRICELEATLAEKRAEGSWPQQLDDFYYIDDDGTVYRCTYGDMISTVKMDERRVLLGNAFRTRDDAKCAVESLKFINAFRKFYEENGDPFDKFIEDTVEEGEFRDALIKIFGSRKEEKEE